MYQTCTEFGFFQTSDSDKQPFGNLFPLKYVETNNYTFLYILIHVSLKNTSLPFLVSVWNFLLIILNMG